MYLLVYLSIYLFIYLSTYLPIYLSVYLSIYFFFFLSIFPSIHPYLCIHLFIHPSIHPSNYISLSLSLSLSIYPPIDLACLFVRNNGCTPNTTNGKKKRTVHATSDHMYASRKKHVQKRQEQNKIVQNPKKKTVKSKENTKK